MASIRLNLTSDEQLLSYQNMTILSVNKLNTIKVTKERDIMIDSTTITTLESQLILTHRLVCAQKYGGDRCSTCAAPNFTGTQCDRCQYGYVAEPPGGNCNTLGK